MRNINWQQLFTKLLETIITLGDLLMVFMQTLIVSFGTLIILALLLLVEQHAVRQGLSVFEADNQSAAFGAVVLVLVNFTVKFMEVYVETLAMDDRRKYRPKEQYAFSLRLFFASLTYWLGIGKKWQKRKLAAASDFNKLRSTVTFAMMTLALMGRTHEAIIKVSANDGKILSWNDGLQRLANQSSLVDITVWVAALIFTFAAVVAAQQLTHYMAMRVVDIRRKLGKSTPSTRSRATTNAIAATGKPVLAFDAPRELNPIKIKIGAATRYQCPQCDKTMSRQAWAKHPCRFTTGYEPVVGSIDTVDLLVDEVDGLTDGLRQAERHLLSTNGSVKQLDDN